MSVYPCKICGRDDYVLPLEFKPEETEAQQEWTTWVCPSCWDIITTLARRIVRVEIQKAQDEIDNMWKEEYCNE